MRCVHSEWCWFASVVFLLLVCKYEKVKCGGKCYGSTVAE